MLSEIVFLIIYIIGEIPAKKWLTNQQLHDTIIRLIITEESGGSERESFNWKRKQS